MQTICGIRKKGSLVCGPYVQTKFSIEHTSLGLAMLAQKQKMLFAGALTTCGLSGVMVQPFLVIPFSGMAKEILSSK